MYMLFLHLGDRRDRRGSAGLEAIGKLEEHGVACQKVVAVEIKKNGWS